jgi:hypothetical protein
MGRTKGATNQEKQPDTIAMPEEQRVNLIADLILEIILEEEEAKA